MRTPLSGAVVTHTYSSPGRFTARVTVRDGRGGTGTASVTIDAGNAPPVPSISSPTSTAGFAVEEIRQAPDRPGQEYVLIARAH